MTNQDKILDGLKVVDLSTFVTGGFCSAMLANQGAEVVKVEQPGYGDAVRHSGPPFIKGESPYYWTLNYGKKSLELDLKNPKAKETLYELVEETDIFIQNFRQELRSDLTSITTRFRNRTRTSSTLRSLRSARLARGASGRDTTYLSRE